MVSTGIDFGNFSRNGVPTPGVGGGVKAGLRIVGGGEPALSWPDSCSAICLPTRGLGEQIGDIDDKLGIACVKPAKG